MQLLADDLDREIPGLFAGTAVVALVPATELRGWAAEMAWKIARAAAAGGRRTVLVDCFVNSPTLHGAEAKPDAEGLVDAFEYGASLNRIVQQQPQADLFFIPAGTYAADAEPVLQNPRWKRLSAGFRHEEALLLLYVGAEHLGTIPADPDGIVVLAPQGQDLAVAQAPELLEAMGSGLPLLAVVADQENAPLKGPTPKPGVPGRREAEPITPEEARHARIGLIVATVFIIVLAIGTAMRFGVLPAPIRPRAWPFHAAPPNAAETALRPAAASNTRAEARARPLTGPEGPGASAPAVAERGLESATPLPFALQIAVLPQLAQAFALSDSLEAHGARTMIAPGRVPGRSRYYRVHLGPFASAARADSARELLVRGGLLARGTGTLASVPLSLALEGRLSKDRAASERARLRRAGLPAFVLGQSDGTYRLFAGAFARTVPRSLLNDLLTPAGAAGEIVPRAGTVP